MSSDRNAVVKDEACARVLQEGKGSRRIKACPRERPVRELVQVDIGSVPPATSRLHRVARLYANHPDLRARAPALVASTLDSR